MAYLILVRHGKSEWNRLGLWTGLTDISLTEEGVREAKQAGEALRDLRIQRAHVSELKRAKQTLAQILAELDYNELHVSSHKALNERDYGEYTGKNKWEIKEMVGKDHFNKIRRGWNVEIPKGETLKDVYARVVPYFDEHILPDLKSGNNVLLVAHGNSLRALIKHVEKLSDESIEEVEVGTGEIHCYEIDSSANVLGKEIRSSNPQKGKV